MTEQNSKLTVTEFLTYYPKLPESVATRIVATYGGLAGFAKAMHSELGLSIHTVYTQLNAIGVTADLSKGWKLANGLAKTMDEHVSVVFPRDKFAYPIGYRDPPSVRRWSAAEIRKTYPKLPNDVAEKVAEFGGPYQFIEALIKRGLFKRTQFWQKSLDTVGIRGNITDTVKRKAFPLAVAIARFFNMSLRERFPPEQFEYHGMNPEKAEAPILPELEAAKNALTKNGSKGENNKDNDEEDRLTETEKDSGSGILRPSQISDVLIALAKEDENKLHRSLPKTLRDDVKPAEILEALRGDIPPRASWGIPPTTSALHHLVNHYFTRRKLPPEAVIKGLRFTARNPRKMREAFKERRGPQAG